jgi:hypothetical protein
MVTLRLFYAPVNLTIFNFFHIDYKHNLSKQLTIVKKFDTYIHRQLNYSRARANSHDR